MRRRMLAVLVLTACTVPTTLVSQTDASMPSDTSAAVVDLSGRWQVTSPMGPTFYLAIEQTGQELRAKTTRMLKCGGGQVQVHTTLGGTIRGGEVDLRTTESQADRYADWCYDVRIMSAVEFKGKISEDANTIKGPFDRFVSANHVWTLKRVK